MTEPLTLTTTTDDVSGLLPGDYGALIVQPVQKASVALAVSNIVVTAANVFHAPIITEDATAAFYAEGADLTGDGATFAELTVTPAKVGRVVPVSNELADDSNPEATQLVGESIARAIARALDTAYFGDLAAPAPKGLESIAEANLTLIEASTTWDSLDPFADAITASEEVGGQLAFFVANPADFNELLKLKKQADSLEPLLGVDATAATVRSLLGVSLISCSGVKPGTVWGIDPRYSLAVLRKDVQLEVSRDVYFETDRTAVKATMRVGFGFSHPKSIAKIKLAAA